MLDIALPRIKSTETEAKFRQLRYRATGGRVWSTLGNALRRVLLSSLPGAAITAIKIEGAQHEFQDIPGVKEDVTDIVLNVKKHSPALALRQQEPVTMRIEVSGERVVTAADIQAPSTVEIVNPGCLHLHAR